VTIASIMCATKAANVPNIKLITGFNMPQIGIGTWQATGDPVRQAVKDALEIGYRHIDTAFIYGNEKEVGQGLNEQITAGIVKREDVFLTTKVWPDSSSHQKAFESIQNSLKSLNVTYLDLVLIHWPRGNITDIWKGLEDGYNQKLVRSIGVSNFEKQHLDTILKTAVIHPSVNQIDVHPTLNQDDLIAYSESLNISITGYSPLGTGNLIKDSTLTSIGTKHNKTAAQVAIRWQIQRGLVVIPKSTHKNYILEDFEVFDFELSADEMKTIHDMHTS